MNFTTKSFKVCLALKACQIYLALKRSWTVKKLYSMTFAYFDNICPCVLPHSIYFYSLEMASELLEIIEIVACNKI